jgi:hypothetical protein
MRCGAHATQGGSGVTVRGTRCKGAQREAGGIGASNARRQTSWSITDNNVMIVLLICFRFISNC